MSERGHRKVRVGVVTSAKSAKTITVSVERLVSDRVYGKGIKRTKTYRAHDEQGVCREGDVVRIRETRPLSRTKRWRLIEVVKRAQ